MEQAPAEPLIPVVVYLPASVHGMCRRLLAADFNLYGPEVWEYILPERSPWSRLIADMVEDFLAQLVEELGDGEKEDTPDAEIRGVYRQFLGVSEEDSVGEQSPPRDGEWAS